MSRPAPPPTRHAEILHAIVESYIETGEPVSSRAVARRLRERLSTATIRNTMADLCDEGLLSQPHTSAGRVPTPQAFRAYVQSLTDRRLVAPELQRLRNDLRRAETMGGRVERSSHILTELSRGIGIAAAIPATSQTLAQVELVSLGDRRVMIVVVTQDGMVRNKVVSLDEALTQDDLNTLRNYLNVHFAGWGLAAARAELERHLLAESAAYDALLRKLSLLYGKGLLDVVLAPEVHWEGASNLVGQDLHLTREHMRELFQALEGKKRILSLLDRFLEQPAGEVVVHVGLGQLHPSMQELSLIGTTISLPGGLEAKVAVLGPIRTDYERTMSAVLHVGHALRSVPV